MGKLVDRKPKAVPRLRDGDRMDQDEFFRRYEADPYVRRAELIDGTVYVISSEAAPGEEPCVPPISHESHAVPHADLITWLGVYAAMTPGTQAAAPSTVRGRSTRNAPEPDATLRVLPEFGGTTAPAAGGHLVGCPELAVEVAHTTAKKDLGPKYELFKNEGVQEYIVWQTLEGVLLWFSRLPDGQYVRVVPDADGIVKSTAFPGLWLDPVALFDRDSAKLLEVLHVGLKSPAHAAFAAKLKKARRKK